MAEAAEDRAVFAERQSRESVFVEPHLPAREAGHLLGGLAVTRGDLSAFDLVGEAEGAASSVRSNIVLLHVGTGEPESDLYTLPPSSTGTLPS